MERLPAYIVRGTAKRMTVTFNCPSPEWAVRKHRDIVGQELTDITITGPDGLPMTLADLEALATEGAVPQPCLPVHHD